MRGLVNKKMNIKIRKLAEADAPSFRAIRLRSLREHPEAFALAFEEEEKDSVEVFAERFRNSTPENCNFGAFVDDQMVGIASFGRHPRLKTRHKAYIGGMYVAPEARGKGLGRALLDTIITHARTLLELEELVLAVTVGNQGARALYVSTGFESYSIEPRYLKVGEQYFDIECMMMRL